MINDDQFKEDCKRVADYYRSISGDVTDLDELLSIPSEQWEDTMSIQAIFQIGYDIRNEPLKDEFQRSMEQLYRLISTRILSIYRMANVFGILNGHWDNIPQKLVDEIELLSKFYVHILLKQSVSDKSLLSSIMRSNPEMLKRILRTCRNSWFLPHYVMENHNGKNIKIRLPGIDRSNDPELFDFIGDTLKIKWQTKQIVMIGDIVSCSFIDNKKTRSHKGTANNILCNKREEYVPKQFVCNLEKISIDNKKDHKTPDWTFQDDSGNIIGTVECYAGSEGLIQKGVLEAIKHGDSKEKGRNHFAKRLKLPDDSIKIATFVCSFHLPFPDNETDLIDDVVDSIPSNTNMDGLLLILVDESTHQTKTTYFDISGSDISYWLKEDVKYCRIPAIFQKEIGFNQES